MLRADSPVGTPEDQGQQRLRKKSALFAGLAILGNVAGNLLLTAGMHQVGPTVSISPLDYIRTLANPLVDGGIVLLILWMVCNLSLLSWADLSYVLPVTAAGYSIAAIMGWVALGEHFSGTRMCAILLITCGAIVVGRTQPRTAPPEDVSIQ